MKWVCLALLFCQVGLAANGYLVRTNGTTQIGNGGGSGSSSDGYLCRTNGTTVLGGGGGSGGAGDGYFTVTNGTTMIGAGAAFAPTDIAGMAYYWNYNDLSQGGTVSSWMDRIQAVDAHQGDATKQPTNSASGVWFNSFQLTNVAFTLPQAKFALWIVFKPNAVTAGFHSLLSDAGGGSGFFTSGATLITYIGASRKFSDIAASVSYDFLYNNGGTGAAGGGVGYTNGVATATITDRNTAESFASIGNDSQPEPYQGYIKFIGIWTNQSLTTTDRDNLYTYSQAH